MAQLKIKMHRPVTLEPVDHCDYSYRWFETQWEKMNLNQVLITLDGSYIKTTEGFDQW